MAQRQAKEIDRLQIIVDRFGAKATKAAMAHSIETRIDRMSANAVEAPTGPRSVHVRFQPPPAPGRTAIAADHLAGHYGDLEVLRGVVFAMRTGEALLPRCPHHS